MSAKILDGKKTAEDIRGELKKEIDGMKIKPCLAVVLVGEDPASVVYVRMKQKACDNIGVKTKEHKLPVDTPEKKLLSIIENLNKDSDVHGILVQLPLPKHINERKIIESVNPSKDVDCFHPINIGRLAVGDPAFQPCTPMGVCEILRRNGINVEGKKVVIVGRSNIVGRPLSIMMSLKKEGANATVTVCHSRTKDIAGVTRGAEVLIAAMGKAEFIKADMVSDGTIVVDVGVNRVDDPSSKKGYKLVGDVDFEAVSKKAGWISPVPGGIGPMTIAMLLTNTVKAAKNLSRG